MKRENRDISLIKLANKDREHFEYIFHSYSEGLVRFAEGYVFDRNEAEDIVQNLFVSLWDNADKIKINTSLKSYLYQSTKNRCLNFIRDLNIRDKHNVMYLEAVISSANLDIARQEVLYEKLERALETLPERMLEIFKLKYVEGKKIAEICEELEVTENTVKTQLKRAKLRITQFMTPLIILIISLLLR